MFVELEGVVIDEVALLAKNPHEGESHFSGIFVELEGVALGPKGRFALQRTLTRVSLASA